jgi:hypothetical protein
MAIVLKADFLGGGSFQRAWGRAALAVRDLRPFWKEIKGWWLNEMSMIFATKGKRAGQNWPPLGAYTQEGPPGQYGRWKQRNYPGMPLLQLHGDLKNAVTGRSTASYEEMTDQKLALGANGIAYLKCMNFGFTPKNIPMRKFISPPWGEQLTALDNRIRKVTNQITKEINAAAKAALGGSIGADR